MDRTTDSSFQDAADSERQVNHLLDSGDVSGALAMATRMLEKGSRSVDFELGIIHERGGDGVPIDLNKAVKCYARAAYQTRCDVTAIYLARALIKVGDFRNARTWLLEAASYGTTARVELGWGLYHERNPDSELELARRHFLRAAIRGRFLGFQGYSRVSRTMRQGTRALAMDCLRVITGPFIALAIGRKAREAF